MTPLESALNAIDISTFGMPDPAPLIRAKCRGLLRGYDHRYRNAGYVPVSVEETLTAPLQNPDTGMPSRTFTVAGKIDLLAEYQGGLYLIDHKLTSHDITDPMSMFWRSLTVDPQPAHYALLLWAQGRKVDGSVWDCIRRPMISPKKLTKSETKAAAATREYFSYRLNDGDIASLAADERETLDMYSARLEADCTRERPDWYFQRRPVPRMDADLLDYARELWQVSQEILFARKAPRQIRNCNACLAMNSPCRYLGICSGHSSIDSDQWTQGTVNNELDVDGSDKNIITQSRVKCFLTCRMKHHYQYELGLTRVDEEEREAIFFGSCIHSALEAWNRAQLPCITDQPIETTVAPCHDEVVF